MLKQSLTCLKNKSRNKSPNNKSNLKPSKIMKKNKHQFLRPLNNTTTTTMMRNSLLSKNVFFSLKTKKSEKKSARLKPTSANASICIKKKSTNGSAHNRRNLAKKRNSAMKPSTQNFK